MKKIKKIVRRIICSLGGHEVATEVYAEKRYANQRSKTPRYKIVEEHSCSCGRVHEKRESAMCFSRAELLKEGWFIEE